jgi:hypothetical protein
MKDKRIDRDRVGKEANKKGIWISALASPGPGRITKSVPGLEPIKCCIVIERRGKDPGGGNYR